MKSAWVCVMRVFSDSSISQSHLHIEVWCLTKAGRVGCILFPKFRLGLGYFTPKAQILCAHSYFRSVFYPAAPSAGETGCAPQPGPERSFSIEPTPLSTTLTF